MTFPEEWKGDAGQRTPKCPSCGSESRYHAADCAAANRIRERMDRETYAKRLVDDPDEYRRFLTESMAAHLVKLDSMAKGGDVKAAEAFRRAAVEALEMIGAKEIERKKGGASGGISGRGNDERPGTGAAAAIASALGETPVELADGEGP